ncbi:MULTISPECIES: hypothetical protein [unclassified Mesorhizobium]|uniref:hypothetical protein n=1 Tax=unclassified Mesorhizobium TaxID=325217 RepID=UPI0033363027
MANASDSSDVSGFDAGSAFAQSAETAAFLFSGISDTGSEPVTEMFRARNLERLSEEPLTLQTQIDMINRQTQETVYPPLSSSTVYWPQKDGVPYEYRQDPGFGCGAREGGYIKCNSDSMHGSILREPSRIIAAVSYFNANFCKTKAF